MKLLDGSTNNTKFKQRASKGLRKESDLKVGVRRKTDIDRKMVPDVNEQNKK